MAELAKKHTERLADIKENIEQSFEYFQDNYDRYNEFMRFVFVSTLNNDEISKLRELQKPPLEFNGLEAYISRLCGEFATQEPSVTVRAADGIDVYKMSQEFVNQLDIIEAHLREILFNTSNDELGYNVYRDMLGGGFSAVEVYTDYINSKSFEQNIYAERVFYVKEDHYLRS